MRPSFSERRRRSGRRGHPPLPGGWLLLVAIARVINGVEIPAAVAVESIATHTTGSEVVFGPSISGEKGGDTAVVGVSDVPAATAGDTPVTAALISGAAMVSGPSRSGDDAVEGGSTAAVGVINVPAATAGDNPATATVVSGAAVVGRPSHTQGVGNCP